jgi:hypothetical protein
MNSSIDSIFDRLQSAYNDMQLQVAILGLMIELDSRKRVQANPDSSCSSDVENTTDSEPQQEIEEDCPDVDISCDQTSEEISEETLEEISEETSEEESLAPSPLGSP